MNRYEVLASSLHHVDSSFKSFNKRVTFASGRVELLQAQFARKEAMLKVEMMENSKEKRPNDDLERELETCRAELEKAIVERTSLAAQIKTDAQNLEQHINHATQEANDEANGLRKMLDDFRHQYDSKSQRVEELSCLLEVIQQELAEAHNEIEAMAKLQIQTTNDIENVKAEREDDLSRQLNDVKREHAKAVVRVRQLERQLERDKEKLMTQVQTLNVEHQEEIKKLTDKLHTTEKDNNILTTTLRQEGLLGRAKRRRGVPVEMPFEESPVSLPSNDVVNPPNVFNPPDGKPPKDSFVDLKFYGGGDATANPTQTEDFLAMLTDLKQLTSEVLSDDDDDDDGGDDDDDDVY